MDIIRTLLAFLILGFVGIDSAATDCNSIETDIIFLIDSSGSIQQSNFNKLLGFAADFANAFNIGPSAAQVGVITFSIGAQEEFTLARYSDQVALTSAIRAIRYTMGGTATDLGLQYAREHGFTAAAGDRPGAPNIVILLTDGISNEPIKTKEQAELLRNMGVEIFAIGIGQGIPSTELDTVATNHEHVYMLDNFDHLSEFMKTIKDSLCQKFDPCFGINCQHGGTCQKTNGAASCLCVAGYTGHRCEADINECSSYSPCLHGSTCANIPGSYICQCVAGYEGTNCQTDVDECAIHNTCVNRATCINTHGSYSCQCTAGYKGNNCQIDIDECATSDLCLHGATCTNTPGSYNCQCADGYTGMTCETDIDECVSSPCQNGGHCHDAVATYTCHCTSRYTDKECQTEICSDLIDNCIDRFGVCLDKTLASIVCRRTCGICSQAEILFWNGTKEPGSQGSHTLQPENGIESDCMDTVQCLKIFGVCRNQTMAETVCRRTCGICGGAHINFG